MAAVFISYRRGDSEGQARALFRDLSEVLGKSAVFMDVDSIALGRDFREVLQKHLASCDQMLVLIGPRWLTAEDSDGHRRLDSPDDYVRQEIAAGLKRKIRVTPILLQGAQVPNQAQLPDGLKDLAYRNGFELSHSRWESDVHEMFQRLGLYQLSEKTTAAPFSSAPDRLIGARPGDRQTEPSALELEYAVGSGEIFLEITVGYAQFGSSRVTVDGKVISSSGESTFSLGHADALAGKILSVATVVADVSVQTNRIGVRYRLSGGPVQFPWTVTNPASTEGGARTFRTSVRLIR